jgi:hypothetical protein
MTHVRDRVEAANKWHLVTILAIQHLDRHCPRSSWDRVEWRRSERTQKNQQSIIVIMQAPCVDAECTLTVLSFCIGQGGNVSWKPPKLHYTTFWRKLARRIYHKFREERRVQLLEAREQSTTPKATRETNSAECSIPKVLEPISSAGCTVCL